jgi:uncharacterized protein YggT (Ycf19 family)
MSPFSVVFRNIIDIYIFIIILRAILSWFQISANSSFFSIYVFIIRLTEPVLGAVRNQLRKLIPNMMIDFSPVLVIILLNFIRNII